MIPCELPRPECFQRQLFPNHHRRREQTVRTLIPEIKRNRLAILERGTIKLRVRAAQIGHLVSGGARQWIPALGFGRGLQRCGLGINVRLARQFPLGLFPIRWLAGRFGASVCGVLADRNNCRAA